MYKLVVVTAVNPKLFEKQHEAGAKSPLVLDNELVIFCAHQNHDAILELRSKYDPDLSKTHIMHFDDHATEAWHLYSQQLSALNTDNLYEELLKLNRFALVRDYFSKNFFKVSHALFINWDASFCEFLERKTIQNLELLSEAQVLFAAEEGKINPELFIVPQEMAWNFNYLNRLEHREAINSRQPKTQQEYFADLLGKYSSQINLRCGTPDLPEKLCESKQPVLPEFNQPKDRITVVINHYQHDTSWINRLHYNAVVYNKNPNEFHLYELNLPNVGFDSIVYFTYIINNYDNLPEYVAFLQDDPFFHCMDVIQIINNFDFTRDFVPMGTSYYLGGHDWKMSEDYAEKVGLAYQRPIKMITSCQSIIKRDLILKRSKEFYQLLVSTIDKTVKCSDNYAIENLWPTIFSFNEELVPCLNCKGHGDKQ